MENKPRPLSKIREVMLKLDLTPRGSAEDLGEDDYELFLELEPYRKAATTLELEV